MEIPFLYILIAGFFWLTILSIVTLAQSFALRKLKGRAEVWINTILALIPGYALIFFVIGYRASIYESSSLVFSHYAYGEISRLSFMNAIIQGGAVYAALAVVLGTVSSFALYVHLKKQMEAEIRFPGGWAVAVLAVLVFHILGYFYLFNYRTLEDAVLDGDLALVKDRLDFNLLGVTASNPAVWVDPLGEIQTEWMYIKAFREHRDIFCVLVAETKDERALTELLVNGFLTCDEDLVLEVLRLRPDVKLGHEANYALWHAIEAGCSSAMLTLAIEGGATCDFAGTFRSDENFPNLLHYAIQFCKSQKDLRVVNFLIETNCGVLAEEDEVGRSLFHRLAVVDDKVLLESEGSRLLTKEIIENLCAAGLKPYKADRVGKTPIGIAKERGNHELVTLFLKYCGTG